MGIKPEFKCVTGGRAGVAMPSLLEKVETTLLQDLADLTAQMFDKADDVFFEFAERVKSDYERNRYFDAMRELRLQRKGIEATFLDMARRAFSELPNPQASLNTDGWATSTLETLQLVNHEELEQNVALEGMISKARMRHQAALRQLVARLGVLVTDVSVTETNAPTDPRQIAEAFRTAVKVLKCDIKSLLIVYKLFDRSILENLGKPLDSCNFMLAKAGILPDLKDTPVSSPRREGVRPVQVAPVAAASAPRDASAQDMAQYLRGLMESVRGQMLPMSVAQVSGPIGSALSGAREVASNDLVGLLSDLQAGVPVISDAVSGADMLPRLDVRASLESVFVRRTPQFGPERVSQQDTDIINLVGFFFDFILDDRNLPVRVKALLGRLQIPLLKVAVKEPAFFGTSSHPARRLLNALAHAGIGLPDNDDALQGDGVFVKISKVVQTILETFTDDVGLFDVLLKDFEDYMGSEVRRAEMIEQRTRSAEEGRALTEQARQAVAQVLSRKREGKTLPAIVDTFLDDAWSTVMFRAWVKHGETGKPWISALQTADLLLQSVVPAASPADCAALENGLPVLQKRLRDGLESISFNVLAGNDYLEAIDAIQQQVVSGRLIPVQEVPAVAETPVAEAPAVALRADLMAPMIRRAAVAPRHEEPASLEPELAALADDDEHLVKARAMGVGTWVELFDGDGGKIRCKIAARIKVSDRVVFVNRSGIKVRDCSTLALAHDLIACRVVVLDDSLLFDRALQSVIGNLRRVREGGLVGA